MACDNAVAEARPMDNRTIASIATTKVTTKAKGVARQVSVFCICVFLG
jgi:hypothetical protein